MLTQSQIIRSLAFAAILSLYDFLPEDDFDQIGGLPSQDGRLILTYNDQVMPLKYGPGGVFLVPGICVEFVRALNRGRERSLCPVIVSIAREILDASIEREQENVAYLGNKLRDMIFKRKECPIYSFAKNDAPITGIVGTIDWHDEQLDTAPPTEEVVGNFQAGGWLRLEFTFTAMYRIR